jgi:hypothetical protein
MSNGNYVKRFSLSKKVKKRLVRRAPPLKRVEKPETMHNAKVKPGLILENVGRLIGYL